MSPLAAPVFAAAALLLVAGAGKVLQPDATRVALRLAGLPDRAWMVRSLGLAEFLVASACVSVGGRATVALVGASYLGFAWFTWRLAGRTRGTASCGCFGTTDAPVGRLHTVLNLCVAAVAGGAIVWPTAGVVSAASETPWAGVPFIGLTLLTAWLLYVSLTLLPSLAAAANRPAGATS